MFDFHIMWFWIQFPGTNNLPLCIQDHTSSEIQLWQSSSTICLEVKQIPSSRYTHQITISLLINHHLQSKLFRLEIFFWMFSELQQPAGNLLICFRQIVQSFDTTCTKLITFTICKSTMSTISSNNFTIFVKSNNSVSIFFSLHQPSNSMAFQP